MLTRLFPSLCVAILVSATGAKLSADERPNFVWLISEDNSKHYLKLFDQHGAETPHIAALAEHGLIFDQAFSNSPVCSVARTTLITGCYAPRIGTQFHRRSVTVLLPGDLRMFPYYLRQAGYFTTNNQKKDYNAVEGDGVWDQSSANATWRSRQPGQPFFHMQSFTTTHESSLHFPEEDLTTKPTATDPQHIALAPYHPDTPTFRYTYARYHDRIRLVDEQIGAVVEQLRQDGLLDDTFIFYFGDHGGVLPRGKGYAYQSGLHIPLVVRVPHKFQHLVDFPIGHRVQGFVSFIDFGPTLLNLAGITPPSQMDGRPFLGRGITRSEVERRDEAYGYADRFDEKYDLVRTLRKGKYEYVRSYQPFNFDGLQNNYRYRMAAYREWRDLYRAGKLNAVQRQFFEPRPAEALYNLDEDPYEVNNVAGQPRYASILSDMRSRLSALEKRLPDLSFYPESDLAARAFGNPVRFGQQQKEEIAKLLDIADLSLIPYNRAERGIETAILSKNPWERYWGLIVCSSLAEKAKPFAAQARKLAQTDPEMLVRTRAAEFLGLIGADDPGPYLREALQKTRSSLEVALILNTVVLLQDGQPGHPINVSPTMINVNDRLGQDAIDRRLEYLLGRSTR